MPATTKDTKRELPPGWRWIRLGEVCEARTGFRDPRTTSDEHFRYVDISSVSSVTKRIVSPQTMLGKDAPSRARQVIRNNDVLVATTRPNLNAVALVPSELDNAICSTGFCVLRYFVLIDLKMNEVQHYDISQMNSSFDESVRLVKS